MRRFGLRALTLLGVVLMLAGFGLALASSPRPQVPAGVEASAEADALAEQMLRSVNAEAWDRTGAVAWTFAGRNEHLWDRERHLARVRWGETEALVDLNTQAGVASAGGRPLEGRAAERAVAQAYAAWVNDSFWLNAVTKAFDPGTQRGIQTLPDGSRRLVVGYTGGGLTPGDLYAWHLSPSGRPSAWSMWVSVLPIGGLEATWEGWTQLPTGAWVATAHQLGPLRVELGGLRAAATLAELESPDPFAPIAPP